MKKIFILASAAIVIFSSCEKPSSYGLNGANKIFIDAWLQVNHPDARKEADGIYVLSETPGTGRSVGSAEDYPYLYLNITRTDLEGNVSQTSDVNLAKQVGTFKENTYIGPSLNLRSELTMVAGLDMMTSSMKVGGIKTALVPGWLNNTGRFKNEKEYMDNVTGTDAIYTVEVVEAIKDITEWQIDSIETYIKRNFHQPADSLKFGFYYIQTQAPSDGTAFDSSDKVNINYTGSLLNGMVFDTTDEIVAKDNGIFSSSKSYKATEVTLNSDYKEIKMGGGSTIDGFSYCISRMKTGEKGICIFISDLGYKGNAQGMIPAYSPLRFEIEMIGKTE